MSVKKDPLSVVVVGAGIVGAAIAFRLAARGAAVTVVDAAEPGQGASEVSFAWINARDKNPQSYHDLNRRSMDMWDRFARELGGNVGLTWGGELRWAATIDGAVALEERVRMLQDWGYRIRLLHAADVRHLEPELQTGPVQAASYSTADGHVDTARVIAACLDHATTHGAEVLVGAPVTDFIFFPSGSKQSRCIQAVETDQRVISCDVVVLAVGADAPDVAALAGIELPLQHTFGATVLTTPLPPIFRRVAVIQTATDMPPPISLRQLPDGRVMIHGGDGATESGSAGRDDAEAQQLLANARRLVPALAKATVAEVRRGRRPIPADGHPILGFTNAVPNLYLAAMHSGVTLSALVSEFSTLEILDGARIDLLAPYRLERFNNHQR